MYLSFYFALTCPSPRSHFPMSGMDPSLTPCQAWYPLFSHQWKCIGTRSLLHPLWTMTQWKMWKEGLSIARCSRPLGLSTQLSCPVNLKRLPSSTLHPKGERTQSQGQGPETIRSPILYSGDKEAPRPCDPKAT